MQMRLLHSWSSVQVVARECLHFFYTVSKSFVCFLKIPTPTNIEGFEGVKVDFGQEVCDVGIPVNTLDKLPKP
jgi:hypothetical protein